jgi:hypothetical protein
MREAAAHHAEEQAAAIAMSEEDSANVRNREVPQIHMQSASQLEEESVNIDLQTYTEDNISRDDDRIQHGNAIVSRDQSLDEDLHIMEEIAQEGLVDESGAIPAFIADSTTVVDANVIGVIESDEELEIQRKRRYYISCIIMSIICVLFLVLAIAVPVSLKLNEDAAKASSMSSPIPTSMPTSVRFADVVQSLLPLSGNKLVEVGSPQNRAARWIADDDHMQLEINNSSFEQRYAMAVLYFTFNDYKSNWHDWLSGETECRWQYVEGPECQNGCINGKVCSLKISKSTLF